MDMLQTFSGHRNCPGQQGLKINNTIYYKIDSIYGPSSWTVNWHMKEGILYADDIEIGGLNVVLTDDKRTVKEVLLSKKNLVANIGDKVYKGYFADYESAKEKGFAELSDYMKDNQIIIKYQDNRDAHGWYGMSVSFRGNSYEIDFDWPYRQSKEMESIFCRLIPLINPMKLQLILD